MQSLPDGLPDQYGKAVSMAAYEGQPFVVIVASGRKLRHIKGWEEGLRESYPELVSARVADITDMPRPSHEQVAEKLRKRAPEGVSIMIDLENRWATAFSLDTEEPCILIFGSNGELRARFRGRANKARLTEVTAALASMPMDGKP